MAGRWMFLAYKDCSKSTTTPCSFLFVVNKLFLNYDPESGGAVPECDMWDNVHPPTIQRAYRSEEASHVLRYSNGRCTRAEGYHWNRPGGWGTQGRIEGPTGGHHHHHHQPNAAADDVWDPDPYRSSTVFFCSPHLPVVVTNTDATLDPTTTFSDDDGGGAYGEHDDYHHHQSPLRWRSLTFIHLQGSHRRGISQATASGHGRPYVAGRSPSWIPKLVPAAFRHPDERVQGHEAAQQHENLPPRSRGLGGELPVVLGLMVFSASSGLPHSAAVHKAFVSQNAYWRGGVWHLERAPMYPNPDDSPRGYFIQMCLDDRNPDSTREALEEFETENGIIVSG